MGAGRLNKEGGDQEDAGGGGKDLRPHLLVASPVGDEQQLLPAVTLVHQGLGHLGVQLHKPLRGLEGGEGRRRMCQVVQLAGGFSTPSLETP